MIKIHKQLDYLQNHNQEQSRFKSLSPYHIENVTKHHHMHINMIYIFCTSTHTRSNAKNQTPNQNSKRVGEDYTRIQVDDREGVQGTDGVNTKVESADTGMFQSDITIGMPSNQQCFFLY